MFSRKINKGMSNINGIPGEKKTIWCNYRLTFQQKRTFYSIGLNFEI